MPGPDSDRPASRGNHTSPAPPSPRPSVASRASGSSLRREQERQEAPPVHPRPTSAVYSRPHTPHPPAAAPAEEPARAPSPPAPPKPTQQQQQQQQPFSPVFALLSSTSHATNRQTIHHPTVHYIFADDDPERLTAALAHHHGAAAAAYDDDNSNGSVPDRGVLLDLEPSTSGAGYEVAWASSLTADWAATSARVSRMEEGGGGGGGGAPVPGLGGNLVLKIEGVSLEPSAAATPSAASGPFGKASSTSEAEMQSSGGSVGRGRPAAAPEEYADLLQDFEKRMVTLRKVVEAGAARQRALGGAGGGQLPAGIPRDVVPAGSRPQTGGDGAQS
ncbi:uncharacterized protein B0H64DRAFT_435584 [Chaetomium fimeti]|uniref:Uncharacterized protein n=1 Tax=Chaetomium fimeti TaxID=1854472 RepID=A0AAE0LNM4_9PEZI|nr:hypothetical protein B0H64DRAFT_435584 [Chaetomium fimeti]